MPLNAKKIFLQKMIVKFQFWWQFHPKMVHADNNNNRRMTNLIFALYEHRVSHDPGVVVVWQLRVWVTDGKVWDSSPSTAKLLGT